MRIDSVTVCTVLSLSLTIMLGPSWLGAETLAQMQDLYKNISNDLMCIRRDFSAAQPKIYAILDRIDKMYNLAKVTAEKKQNLSKSLKNRSGELKKLQDEINALRSKAAASEEELKTAHAKLSALHNALQTERSQAARLSQEKTQLSREQEELQSKLHTTKKQADPKDLMHKIKDLSGLTEEERAILKQAQSLSLSSTSAPNSPR